MPTSTSDVDSWTTNLIRLLSDRQLAINIGNTERDRAWEKFSKNARNQSFLEIYNRLLDQYKTIDVPMDKLLSNTNQKLIANS